MLLDDRQDGQRADVNLSVLETLVLSNHRSLGSLGTLGRPGWAEGAWFGRKRVSETDPIVSGRGAGRHQRAGQLVSTDTHWRRVSVLPSQELDLDLGVLLASPSLPGRRLQSGSLQAGGGVLVVRGVNIPEPSLARLLFSTGNF